MDSKKLLYLMQAKAHLVDAIDCLDVNQEMVEARKFLDKKVSSGQTTNLRQVLYDQFKLVNNQRGDSKFYLPQAFVCRELKTFVGKKLQSKQTHTSYLGDFQACQFLEDSNLLDPILTKNLEQLESILVCKYRIFNGIPIFRF